MCVFPLRSILKRVVRVPSMNCRSVGVMTGSGRRDASRASVINLHTQIAHTQRYQLSTYTLKGRHNAWTDFMTQQAG
jgi:hypothetical protein